MLWKNSPPFNLARALSLPVLISGFLVLGCSRLEASSAPSRNFEENSVPNAQKITQAPNTTQQRDRPSSPQIAEGLYWIGNTGLGLEVRGGRFRYYDEEGPQKWRDLVGLTSVKESVIFDGHNYWCWSQSVPRGTVGTCTAQGWQTVNLKAEEKPAQISPLEFSLGGVRLGDSAATTRRNLGEPNRISSNIYDGIRWQYSGLEIDLGERGAFGMKSTNARYCTPSGVCPGMAFSEVRSIYGTPTVSDRGSEGIFREYYSVVPDNTCWLKIALDSRERVKSIEVACAV